MKRSTNNKAAGCVAAVLSIPLIIITAAIVNGWALSTLWRWFVVPTFESAPTLTIPTAIGISLVFHFLTGGHSDEYAKDKLKQKGLWYILGLGWSKVLMRPLFAVGIGYVVLVLS